MRRDRRHLCLSFYENSAKFAFRRGTKRRYFASSRNPLQRTSNCGQNKISSLLRNRIIKHISKLLFSKVCATMRIESPNNKTVKSVWMNIRRVLPCFSLSPFSEVAPSVLISDFESFDNGRFSFSRCSAITNGWKNKQHICNKFIQIKKGLVEMRTS